MEKKRLLIGSCICQSKKILGKFLLSLNALDLSGFDAAFMFVDDNQEPESSELLREAACGFGHEVLLIKGPPKDTQYHVSEDTHYWNDNLVMRVAGMKNGIIEYAVKEKYDYLFLIDSDLLIVEGLIGHLAAQGRDIICEVFWTAWQPGTMPMPNAWMFDMYELSHPALEKEERDRQSFEFMAKLREPDIYEVGGLGACTLISAKALQAGVNFTPIKNISFWGEDRWFCIRAAAMGIPLYLDTYFPAVHLYRESEA
jgi:hypothetical protein